MNVIIAGGAGFIGSHLCNYFVTHGHTVLCIDNFITGRFENVEELDLSLRFSMREGSICDMSVLHDYYEGKQKCDIVFNLASLASPIAYMKNKIETLWTGTIGSFNLLELCQKQKCLYFLASTSEVYGDPAVSPQVESYYGNVNSFGPRSCYDESKRCAEAIAYSYAKERGVNIRIARIFNTYGPNMDSNDGRVVSNFIVQCLTGKNITITWIRWIPACGHRRGCKNAGMT